MRDDQAKETSIAEPLTVAVVARTPSVRLGLRAMLEGRTGVALLPDGAGAGADSWTALDALADVVALDYDDDSFEPVLAACISHATALVVLGGDADLPARLAGSELPGWGVLPRDVAGDELAASLVAADAGLAVMPSMAAASLAERDAIDTVDSGGALTGRELEVLRAMADGLANKQIASRLGVSIHTVKFHVASILAKLDAGSRTEAVAAGIRSGWVHL